MSSLTQLWDTARDPSRPESPTSDLRQQQSTASSLPDYEAKPVALPNFGMHPGAPPEHKVQPTAPSGLAQPETPLDLELFQSSTHNPA